VLATPLAGAGIA
jgi:hypothetical protein